MVASPLMARDTLPPQEIEHRNQRQAEDREIVAVDPFEQLNAGAFDLIAADAVVAASPTASR